MKFCSLAVFCYGAYLVCSQFLLGSITVVGRSMQPSFRESDYYLLNRWILYLREPNRAAVVVLRDPAVECFSIKRVIGRPGDSVCLRDGAVYVNGAELHEPYLLPGTKTFVPGSVRDACFKCRENEYFLLGDNRAESADSRDYGPVSGDRLLGVVMD